MNRCVIILGVGMFLVATSSFGQNWQRREATASPDVAIFQSPQAIGLPTAETISRGNWQFEIAHRFLPPFSDGTDAFFGLDGPVNYRLALGLAITDRLMVTLARSNLDDNVDLQAKYKLFSPAAGGLPVMLAIQLGAAWNSEVAGPSVNDDRKLQSYAQAIFNLRLSRTFAIGLVPSYVSNFAVRSEETEHMVALGINGQVNVNRLVNLLGEWVVQESGYNFPYDAAAFGVELNTGGHFFKIVATNSVRLNPSQYLPGAVERFEPDRWRLGFSITRLLQF